MPIESVNDFEAFEKAIDEMLEDFVDSLARRIINRATRNAPFFQGLLSASIIDASEKDADGNWFIGSNLPYARIMEKGHGPYTPPLEPLKNWARIKLGDESLGGAVWHKIREEGVEAHPYLYPAVRYVLDNEADKLFKSKRNQYLKQFKI